MGSQQATLPFFCGRDCGGDACPLRVSVDGGRVLEIRHNRAAGPYIRGCSKGFSLHELHYSPFRIRTPLLRTGPRGSRQFTPIPWEAALDIAAKNLSELRAKHGPATVLNLSSGGGTGALHGTERLTRRFLNISGGCTYPRGNYSSNAANYALKLMLGEDYGNSGFDAATMEKAELVVLWGANLLETRLGAELPSRLVRARKRGTPIVMVDPRYSKTAKALGAKWIGVRPGKDREMLYGLLHEILIDPRFDPDFVTMRSEGFAALSDYVLGKIDGVSRDAKWAGEICGVEPKEISSLADLWLSKSPTMLIPGYSIQRTFFGEENFRLTVALQLATKNLGREGGSSGSINNRLPSPRMATLPARGSPETREIAVLRWPDAILEGRPEYPTDIHAAYVVGSNFLNQGADIRKNIEAFEKLDFSICHEMFLTPTAAYCDLVLPAASPFQKEDIGIPWSGNYLLYKPKILPYEGQERSDFDIFSDLSSRLGFEEEFSEGKTEVQWIDDFIDDSDIRDAEEFKADGIFLGKDQERVGLRNFSIDPGENPLATKSGKIEFASPLWKAGGDKVCGPDRGNNSVSNRFTLSLLSTKTAGFVHSQGGQRPEKIHNNRLWMNPEDAEDRNIAGGDRAKVWNAAGCSVVEVLLDDSIVRGAVNLPEGYWYSPDENGLDQAGSANVLTSTAGTQESVSCVMHAIPVEVEAYESNRLKE